MSIRKRTWSAKNKDTGELETHEAWVTNYTDQDGKRRLKTFKRQKDAVAWLADTIGEVRRGTHVAESSSVTVKEAAERWIENVKRGRNHRLPAEEATLRQYRYHLTFILPRFGRMKVAQLSRDHVETFRNHLLDVAPSRSTAKKVLTSFKGILADARSPAAVGVQIGLGGKNGGEKKIVLPTVADVTAILTKLDEKAAASPGWHRWRAVIATAVHTGMRASELRGLPWSAVDLKRGEIHVTQRADENGVVSSKLKSVAAERTIKIPSALVQLLREWKLRTKHALVFATGTGKPESLANIFNRAWVPVQLAAGVVDKAGRDEHGKPIKKPRYNFHALRHYHASALISIGADPKEVQVEMGHSSIQITFDVYGKLFSDEGTDKRRSERAEQLAGLLNVK